VSLAEFPDIAKNVAFANGNTHPELGKRVAALLGIELSPVKFARFADTETYVRHEESVRGKLLVAFQTHAPVDGNSTADSFYQHLQMIDAGARGGAAKVMAVAPCMAGSRQDRQVLPREAVSADLNLDLLRSAGATHFVTVDIHDTHTLTSFRKPGVYDHLTAQPALRAKLAELMIGDQDDYIMIAPDEGHSKILRAQAELLGVELKDMVKTRDKHREVVSHVGRVGDVEGKTCFIMDDMISTGGTVASAAEKLHESGAKRIYVAATHPWFSGSAAERLADAPIEQIIVTDTLPIRDEVQERLGNKLQIVSSAELIADGLKQILIGGSVSGLYEGQGGNYS